MYYYYYSSNFYCGVVIVIVARYNNITIIRTTPVFYVPIPNVFLISYYYFLLY